MYQDSIDNVMLKRSILVEERTAIWCPSCAEIDPELEEVAKAHGSRIALVGLHINDAFENDASLARIAYQEQINDNETYGTPTFFVDGLVTAEGYDAWQDVQKRILIQESSRQSPENYTFDLSDENFNISAPDFGQISIMIVEHEKSVPEGEDNPGEDHRDRVLIGMKVINSTGVVSEYGDLKLPEKWSIIVSHEPEDGGVPYGVVEITNQKFESSTDYNLLTIVAISIVAGALIVYLPQNNPRNKEEE